MSLVKHTGNYTTMGNYLIQSDKLSFGAIGMYSFINSKPDDWKFSYWRIAKEKNASEYEVEKLCKELKKFGLLVQKPRQKIMENGIKKFDGYEYHLYENISEKRAITAPPKFSPPVLQPPCNYADDNKQYNNKPENKKKESNETPKEINKVEKPSIPSLSLNSKSFEITQNEVVEAKKEISKELITSKLGLDSEEMSEYKTIFDLYKFLNIKKQTTIEEFNQILDNPPKGFENGKFSTMCWGGWINEIRSKNLQNKKEKENELEQNALKTILTTKNILFSEYAKEFWLFSDIEEKGYSKEEIYNELIQTNSIPNYSKYQNLINEFYKNKTN